MKVPWPRDWIIPGSIQSFMGTLAGYVRTPTAEEAKFHATIDEKHALGWRVREIARHFARANGDLREIDKYRSQIRRYLKSQGKTPNK